MSILQGINPIRKHSHGGTITVAASDAPDRVKRLADYVCDGIDDHVEIQAAIDALPETGGVVQLSAGVFVGHVRILKDNVTLAGAGAGSTVIMLQADASPNDDDAPVRVLANGVTVRDLTADGNSENNVGLQAPNDREADAIAIYGDDVIVHRCTARNCWGHGVIVWNEAFPRGAADPIVAAGPRKRVVVDSCSAVDNAGARAGFESAGTDTGVESNADVRFVSNYADGSWSADLVGHTAGSGIVVANNTLTNGISMHSGDDGPSPGGRMTIAGNTVSAGLISVTGGYLDVLISANAVKGGPEASRGVFVSGVSRAVVIGNSTHETGRGVELLNCSDVIISANTISGASAENVLAREGCSGVAIFGNQMSGGAAGVRIQSGDVAVMKNRITATSRGVDTPDSGSLDDVAIYDNDIIETAGSAIRARGLGGRFCAARNRMRDCGNDTVSLVASGDVDIIENSVTYTEGKEQSRPLRIDGAGTLRIARNRVRGADRAIRLLGSMPTVAVISNNVFQDIGTSPFSPGELADLLEQDVTMRGNIGFATENAGTATIASASTSVTVSHGLDVTPEAKDTKVTPLDFLGSASQFRVTAVGASSFDIELDQAPGADVEFAWQVVVN